ncbi:hypothetical protein C8R43DRAFT_843636, partial [Mycena crocata]
GAEWADCVNRYLDFEAASGYSEKGPRMGGGDVRPEEVKDWIHKGRSTLGKIGDQGGFVDSWWAWWRSVQPAERKWAAGGGLSCPAGMKWGKLATMCGPNGILQVMLALLWWGTAVVGKGAESEDWTSAVADVDFALGEML